MQHHLNKLEALVLIVLVAVLVTISLNQHRLLKTHQLDQKKAEYAKRIRTTQLILETQMLRSAYLTSVDPQVKTLVRTYLEGQP